MKLNLLGWRERETRWGSMSQHELVIEYNIEGTNRDIYVTLVLRDSDNAEELAKQIATKITPEAGTIERLS